MLVWCSVLLFLGIAAFLDSIFTFSEIFRTINSVLFMLVSLGLLVRISFKKKQAITEKYLKRIDELEKHVEELSQREKVEVK